MDYFKTLSGSCKKMKTSFKIPCHYHASCAWEQGLNVILWLRETKEFLVQRMPNCQFPKPFVLWPCVFLHDPLPVPRSLEREESYLEENLISLFCLILKSIFVPFLWVRLSILSAAVLCHPRYWSVCGSRAPHTRVCIRCLHLAQCVMNVVQ